MKNGNNLVTALESDVTSGLTKREYFAGLAMQALVGNNFSPTGFQNGNETGLAEIAIKCADALLAELDKEVKP